MKKYAIYIFIASVTFVVGVIFTFSLINNFTQESYLTTVKEPVTKEPTKLILPTQTEIEDEYPNLFDNNLDNVKTKLPWLLKDKKVTKKQTIYLSKDYIHAYWVEDRSLVIVSAIDAQNAKFGIFDKACIDLETQVVPTGKYGNLGCCLVEKGRVEKIIAKCKKGVKLKL